MNQKGVKIAALTLAGAIACTNIPVSNAAGVRTLFPAAGFALIIGDGVPISEVIGKAGIVDRIKEDVQTEHTTQGSIVTLSTTLKEATETDEKPAAISTSVNTEEDKDSEMSGEQKDDPFGSGVLSSTDTETDETKESEKAEPEENKETKPEESVSGNDTKGTDKEEETVSGNDVEEPEESVSDNDVEQDFSNLVIARVSNYVNVRSEASEESEIVGKLYNKSVGTFIEEENGWYKIHSGTVEGYVKGEYCVTGKEAEALVDEVGEKIAVVTTTTLKVRKEPGLDKEVLGLVPIEEELSVLEETEGWVKVSIEEGEGYVSRDYVSLRVDFVEAESKEAEEARLKREEEARRKARAAASARMAENAAAASQAPSQTAEQAPAVTASSSGSAAGQAVANYALQFVGNPYVYGGSSLTHGTDCSGFAMSVYANFGVALPHSSSADRRMGYDVGGLANAQPGDLVCYSGHVAIYIGNGQIVHASSPRTGIVVSNAGYRQVLAVRRIF